MEHSEVLVARLYRSINLHTFHRAFRDAAEPPLRDATWFTILRDKSITLSMLNEISINIIELSYQTKQDIHLSFAFRNVRDMSVGERFRSIEKYRKQIIIIRMMNENRP